jgi:putative addiction module killer protein
MVDLRKTDVFASWLKELRDSRARAKIRVRVDRFAQGNPGDVGPVGEGVSEMRIDYGPGYRVYFVRRGAIVTLLCGGDKSTQAADIGKAKILAKDNSDDD